MEPFSSSRTDVGGEQRLEGIMIEKNQRKEERGYERSCLVRRAEGEGGGGGEGGCRKSSDADEAGRS